MADLILGIILAVIVIAAILYIVKEKKRGVKCIGCSAACNCSGKTKGADGCGCCSCQKEE